MYINTDVSLSLSIYINGYKMYKISEIVTKIGFFKKGKNLKQKQAVKGKSPEEKCGFFSRWSERKLLRK